MQSDILGYPYFGVNIKALDSFKHITTKLEEFTGKYYTKLLLKGVLLFITLGALLFLFITGVEYFFWLGSLGRGILFILFVVCGLYLGYRYLVIPVLYLFKVKKGITRRDASVLIGKHFPEVGDKLQNLLELQEITRSSDLLLAAIEQRSREMRPFVFTEAVNFRESYKHFRYLLVPIFILGLLWITGGITDFFSSYKRVVHYDMAYTPPAPFHFQLINQSLTVLEGQPLTIAVATVGEYRPGSVEMVVDGKRLTMQQSNSRFEYTLQPGLGITPFHFQANDIRSRGYDIRVTPVPAITDFQMHLQYPPYLKRGDRVVTGTGNAVVPEGTRINWMLKGVNTSSVAFVEEDSVSQFSRIRDEFRWGKTVFEKLSYGIATSNDEVKNYERLFYDLDVIKDESPTIKVIQELDSLNPNLSFYEGLGADDHEISSITMVYYPADEPQKSERLVLGNPGANVEQFYYTFPTGIDVDTGREYALYFEVRDNDPFRNGKVTRSAVFRTKVLDAVQLEERRLNNQEQIVSGLKESLKQLGKQREELDRLNKEQKESNRLDYNSQQKIGEYLKQQETQEAMMEKFTKELKENIVQKEAPTEKDRMLLERLERQEIEAKKNQALLEKLNEVANKIEEQELQKKLEELAKSQNSGVRNLEQLVELTKRYYVTEKARQLAEKLKTLAEEQEALSDRKLGDDIKEEDQELMNDQFEKISKELNELEKDNQDLQKPVDLQIDRSKEQGVKEDQEDALEEMGKHQQMKEEDGKRSTTAEKAKQKQRSAASKMKEMAKDLAEGAVSGAGGSTVAEDAEMLRQILDNLLVFSFQQEQLFNNVEDEGLSLRDFSGTIREQKELQGLFGHIDDSLFALSLRRAELSELVNEQIAEVYYNMDKALEGIAENQMYQAASYQQYTFTAANVLADFLADILDNMQQSMMSGEGKGQGEGFQLPDIIKSQQQLQEKMSGKEGNTTGESTGKGQEGGKKEGGKQGNEGGGEGAEKTGNSKRNGKGSTQGEVGDTNGGNGVSEEALKEIYEIYQEQQTIRKRLEEQLQNIIDQDKRGLAKKLALEMERFEEELLREGITRRTVERMNRIEHQLLKLENAALKQGKRKERESTTGIQEFSNPVLTKPDVLQGKKSAIEILNRQALPLQPHYQNKVKLYFNNGY